MANTETITDKKELPKSETAINDMDKRAIKDIPKEELKSYLYKVIRSRIVLCIPSKEN